MQIDKKLYDEINDYCKLNNLKTKDFIHNILKDAFLKEKYGDSPFFFKKNIEKCKNEIIIEKNVEPIIISVKKEENMLSEKVNLNDKKDNDVINDTALVDVQKPKKKRKLK